MVYMYNVYECECVYVCMHCVYSGYVCAYTSVGVCRYVYGRLYACMFVSGYAVDTCVRACCACVYACKHRCMHVVYSHLCTLMYKSRKRTLGVFLYHNLTF